MLSTSPAVPSLESANPSFAMSAWKGAAATLQRGSYVMEGCLNSTVRQLAEPAASSCLQEKRAPHSSRKITASANAGSMSGCRASSRQPRSGSAIGCTQSCAARSSAGRADSSAAAPASCATSAARKARQSPDACPTWAPWHATWGPALRLLYRCSLWGLANTCLSSGLQACPQNQPRREWSSTRDNTKTRAPIPGLVHTASPRHPRFKSPTLNSKSHNLLNKAELAE